MAVRHVTDTLAPRNRKVKILATLGPASSDAKMIRKLMIAGADAFRINMSHGDQKQKAKLVTHIRALEKEFHRPTTILFDLQGPKLRVGHFDGGRTDSNSSAWGSWTRLLSPALSLRSKMKRAPFSSIVRPPSK